MAFLAVPATTDCATPPDAGKTTSARDDQRSAGSGAHGYFDTTTRIGFRPTGTVAMTRLVPVSMTRRSFEPSCTTNSRVP